MRRARTLEVDPPAAPDFLEVGAVCATGVLHQVVSNGLGWHGPFIAAAILFWGAFLTRRIRRDARWPARWGLRRTSLRPAAAATTCAALLALTAFAVIGNARGRLEVNAHLVVLLLAYPAWGLLQQLLVQGFAVRNLLAVRGPLGSAPSVTLVAAALFAVVHLPDPELTLATFLLGLVFTPIYLRWRNLWPLGLWHGWLGAFAYLWVLGRDPVAEILG